MQMKTEDYIRPKRAKKIAYCTYHSCIITAAMAKKHGCNANGRCQHMALILGGNKGSNAEGK